MESQNYDTSEYLVTQLSIRRNSNSNLGLPNNFDNSSYSHQLVSTNSFELNAATSLSEDSGLPHTNSSVSSGDSIRVGLCKFEFELAESDGEVSQFDSLDNCSDSGMSAENFNTLKKGPLAPIDPPPEFQDSPQTTLMRSPVLQTYALKISRTLITNAIKSYETQHLLLKKENVNKPEFNPFYDDKHRIGKNLKFGDVYGSDSLLNRQTDNIYDIPNGDLKYPLDNLSPHIIELQNKPSQLTNNIVDQGVSRVNGFNLHSEISEIYDYDIYYKNKKTILIENVQKRKAPMLYSPLHYHPSSNLSTANRPNSRNSLNSRLSSSHNSLTVPTSNKADDSIFITQAMSHDTLTGRDISDFYNVPMDSDIYALPIDVIKPELKEVKSIGYKNMQGKLKYVRNNKKRRKPNNGEILTNDKYGNKLKISKSNDKRHSVPDNTIEPMHMTLNEVKRFYHSLYSSSSETSDIVSKNWTSQTKTNVAYINNNIAKSDKNILYHNNAGLSVKVNKGTTNIKNKVLTTKEEYTHNIPKYGTHENKKSNFSISMNLKQKFCSIFRFRKSSHNHNNPQTNLNEYEISRLTPDVTNDSIKKDKKIKFSTRALPPLPAKISSEYLDINEQKDEKKADEVTMDFATNIEKVKEYGWYWGPISSETAEKILSNEPDGSFIVRDSSDDHYIFSLTFKLNNSVRHVRIEQDQGKFSFGSCAKFKSHTIMEFIENAVESSRSGRYLFFFHRRPEHGPMRVQLTNPVSRFKHIQSLQHMCRFIIRKAVVRKDLIQSLPLPRRLLDYLSYKNCYSEQVESDSSQSQMSYDGHA